jgi:hypothetical protein
MFFRRLKLKFRYYYREFLTNLGICPICFSRMNYLRSGRFICPNKIKH